jgi:hypothetical protein
MYKNILRLPIIPLSYEIAPLVLVFVWKKTCTIVCKKSDFKLDNKGTSAKFVLFIVKNMFGFLPNNTVKILSW